MLIKFENILLGIKLIEHDMDPQRMVDLYHSFLPEIKEYQKIIDESGFRRYKRSLEIKKL